MLAFTLGAALGLFVFQSCLAPSATWAQPPTATLPSGGALTDGNVQRRSGFGLSITFDTRGVCGSGYRPIRVRIVPTTPVTADRTLSFAVTHRRMRYPYEHQILVAQAVEIPAGSGPVETTIAVPSLSGGPSSWKIEVSEDGKVVPRLCPALSMNSQVPSHILGGNLPLLRIFMSGNTLSDTSRLAQWFDLAPVMQYMNVPTAVGMGGNAPNSSGSTPFVQLPSALALPIEAFPKKWIEYTNLDVVCLSMDQLDKLRMKHRRAFDALLAWTAAGGNLWIYGVGNDWERLAELESWVEFPVSEETAPQARGWSEPDDKLFGRPLMWGMGVGMGAPTPEPPKKPKKKPRPKPPERPPFLLREYQMGQIVAIAAADPFPGTETDWGWLVDSVGPNRLFWSQRHGLSTIQENADFWNFLIPGVGLAPVTAFRVLITLFVIVIGPVNYFLLRRWKRLHLLVITIPTSAALVTGALFGYALVADGLGTRVRARSYTEIDQRRGRAVCWARLSYYSGIAPSGGLTFPKETAVFSLAPNPTAEPRYRELIWDDRQWLARGWLRSRTPTQYLTVRSRKADLGLEIIPAKKGSKDLGVKNRLGTRIEHLVVRAEDGKHYASSAPIDAGATAALAPLEADKALGPIRLAEMETRPSFPPGMNRRTARRNYGRRFGWYASSRSSGLLVTQETSLLEWLIRLREVGKDAQPDQPLLEPKSYVALVHQGPEVVFGTPGAREEAGFHLVRGTW